jgi:4-hydroxyphenylpyruvate dioxygenase
MTRRAIATVCLSGTLEEKLAAAAAAGFDAVELFENDLIGSPLRPAEVRELAAELGLGIDLYQPFRDFEAVPAERLERNLARAEAKFAVMDELGADLMLVCSNVSAAAIDDDALAAAQLAALAERAAAHGIRIAYEALAWGRHVDTFDHAWRIVERAGHPALGTCLDTFHILSRGSDPAGIRDIPGEKLFFLQLADAPYMAMDVLQWSRHHRCFPGQGGLDVAAVLHAALDAGYRGPLSLEVFNDVFRAADPDRMAVDAMRSLLILEDALPAPASLDGFAFVELGLDSTCAPETEATLEALGFTHTGQHRSKPVQLWEQGDARVVINRGEAPGKPRVVALAFETPEPETAAARAEALQAPILPERRRPDEAALRSILAPDGTSVIFCRAWHHDFLPVAEPAAGELRAIDHLALSQPYDYFDEAALFYRSVLGLAAHESQELAAPDGLIRSRAVADERRRVRLALNVPLVAGGTATELQHIAFTCDDALAAAHRFAGAGVPLLRISDNYYDDLAARTGLAEETIEALRDTRVLYDADEHGELLHFFTEVVGDRLFFEVLERRGGYDGYGAVNSAVRLGAQRAERQLSRP